MTRSTAAPKPTPPPPAADIAQSKADIMKHGYSSLQIALHWTVAALFAVNWLLGEQMAETFDAYLEGAAVPTLGAAYTHVFIGLSILLLMAARLSARVARPVAVAPDSDHPLLATLGRVTHLTFYALLILIPIGGAIAWFAGNELAGTLHGWAVTAALVLIAVHVTAALFHQFVLRDGLIRRMLRDTGGT